ncbi:abortive phage resistance protein [Bacillus sp. JCM 19046]|nr:abortive phage resistance protein [Bacillus sp. JCM 19045]GAF18850.1 abortive phage resistance protein [Bacillus sp. JCM 19046]
MDAIQVLDKGKFDLTTAIEYYEQDNYLEISKINDLNFQECRLIFKRLSDKIGRNNPDYIINCRTIKEVVENLFSSKAFDHNSIKNLVNVDFNEYIDYLEENSLDVSIVRVENEIPYELTFDYILESVTKCENRIESGDYSGAVTSAKTLVEGVCKEILNKFLDYNSNKKTDLPILFTKVREKLNLNPKDPKLDNSLKDVLTGLIKIVNGISEIRNKPGDSHIPRYKIDRHHALLVVNSAKTVSVFLFNSFEYQKEKRNINIEETIK